MSIEEQQNNPLHGLSPEKMMTELVEFYGWKVLYAGMGLRCFKIEPTIPSCLTFLKKTDWARYKVENFYLYRFKGMPKARDEQFELKPRERGFANGIEPRKPVELTVEQMEHMVAKSAEARNSRSRKY